MVRVYWIRSDARDVGLFPQTEGVTHHGGKGIGTQAVSGSGSGSRSMRLPAHIWTD